MDRSANRKSLNLDEFDPTSLLHPAQAFVHPMDVVNDLDLTLSEKRAMLAAWVSDSCAVEAAPGLRRVGAERTVQFDDIIDALRELDRLAAGLGKGVPHYRQVLADRSAPRLGRRRSGREGASDQGRSAA